MSSSRSPEARHSVSIAMTGAGGAGVVTAGNMLLRAAAKAGWYGLFNRASGPQIRGGEAASLVRLSARPVACPDDLFDIMVAIDWHNTERFGAELPLGPGSLVFADPGQGEPPEAIAASGARFIELPMKKMVKAIPGGRPNMIALGVVSHLIGLDVMIVDGILARALKKKGEAALVASKAAVRAGAEYAVGLDLPCIAAPQDADTRGRMLISGNQAAGFGALKGGVRFAAAYPITPATDLLEWITPNLKALGGLLVQAEDELAAINMIIGGSFGGTPSLTATSGPGLALMTEALGLAVAAEIPLVLVNVMRGGPSTGIPTKSEQGDLNIALFGLHGDAPHLVLGTSSVADCLTTTRWATCLAENLQCPAIVLSDQSLGQAYAITDRPAELEGTAERVTAGAPGKDYHRYITMDDGISPMSIPGTVDGEYTADGLEHNIDGTPSSQVSDHLVQLDKRAGKLNNHEYGPMWADIEGDGPLAIITWGSSAGAVREALARIDTPETYRLIVLRLLAPALPARFAAAMKGTTRALTIEQSHTGQFHHYLKGYFDPPGPMEGFYRPGPLPLRPAELVETITKWSAP